MKFPIPILLLLILSLVPARAERDSDKPRSAFEALKEARHQLEKFGKHLLTMESEGAKLRPRYWWIRFYDDSLFLKVRAVQMIGPEMIKNVEPGNPFDGGDLEHVISPDSLKIDSEKCISFIERSTKDSGIPLHSIKIKLEKPYPGESSPIWFFELFDSNNKKLGKINISATTGKVTEIVGLKLRDRRFSPVSKRTPGQALEDTFIGVGADLEETFTGKRTIDQEGNESGKSGSKNPEE